MNDGGNAFPAAWQAGESGEYWVEYSSGMTLRDYFAAKALPALIALESDCYAKEIAHDAYLFADAMLKARSA